MVACLTFQRERALPTSLSQKQVSSGLQEKASFVTRFSSRWTLCAFIVCRLPILCSRFPILSLHLPAILISIWGYRRCCKKLRWTLYHTLFHNLASGNRSHQEGNKEHKSIVKKRFANPNSNTAMSWENSCVYLNLTQLSFSPLHALFRFPTNLKH